MNFDIKDDHVVSEINKNVIDVAVEMRKNRRFNHVIVLDGKKPVGTVSLRDIVERVVADGKDPKKTKISEIMTKSILTIREDQNSEEIADIMIKNSLLSLPVVNKDEEFLGVVSIYDVVDEMRKS